MPASVMEPIGARIVQSTLLLEVKSIDITSKQVPTAATLQRRYLTDNPSRNPLLQLPVNHLHSLQAGQIVAYELRGLILLQSDFRDAMEMLVNIDDLLLLF